MSVISFFMIIDVDFLLLYPIIHFIYIYIDKERERERERDEPNGKLHLNLIKKFELETNLIISETKVEPEPCHLVVKELIILDPLPYLS